MSKNKTFNNPCVRCGKERIVIHTWEEKTTYSIVINTETACPDPECQKLVTAENKKQTDKQAAIKKRSDERAVERRASRTKKIPPKKASK